MDFVSLYYKMKRNIDTMIERKDLTVKEYAEILDISQEISEKIFGRVKRHYFPTLDIDEIRRIPELGRLENISRSLASENITTLNVLKKKESTFPITLVLDSPWAEGTFDESKLIQNMYQILYNGDYLCIPTLYKCIRNLTFFEKAALSMYIKRKELKIETTGLESKMEMMLDNICVGMPGLVIRDLPTTIYKKYIKEAVSKIWSYIESNKMEELVIQGPAEDIKVVIDIQPLPFVEMTIKDCENATEMVGAVYEGEILQSQVFSVENNIIITQNNKMIDMMEILGKVELIEEIEENSGKEKKEKYIYTPSRFLEDDVDSLPEEMFFHILKNFSLFECFGYRLVSKKWHNCVARLGSFRYCMRKNTFYSQLQSMVNRGGENSRDISYAISKGIEAEDYILGRNILLESIGNTIVPPVAYLSSLEKNKMNKMIYIYEVFRELFHCNKGTFRFFYWFDMMCRVIKEYYPVLVSVTHKVGFIKIKKKYTTNNSSVSYVMQAREKHFMVIHDEWKRAVMESYGLSGLYYHLRVEMKNFVQKYMPKINDRFLMEGSGYLMFLAGIRQGLIVQSKDRMIMERNGRNIN